MVEAQRTIQLEQHGIQRSRRLRIAESKPPRVVELLRKAIEWQALLESGEASNQAAIARREGITRTRLSQVMGMLRLAPEIQEHVLSLPGMIGRAAISERAIRPIAQILSPKEQLQAFQAIAVNAH